MLVLCLPQSASRGTREGRRNLDEICVDGAFDGFQMRNARGEHDVYDVYRLVSMVVKAHGRGCCVP